MEDGIHIFWVTKREENNCSFFLGTVTCILSAAGCKENQQHQYP
jgi:hypothetical protein